MESKDHSVGIIGAGIQGVCTSLFLQKKDAGSGIQHRRKYCIFSSDFFLTYQNFVSFR